MEKLVYTPDEAALVLGISRSKMYGLLATGQLPRIHVGHVTRIPRGALEAWIRSHMASGEPEVSTEAGEGLED